MTNLFEVGHFVLEEVLDMELNKDKLFNELVPIVKNCGAEEVNTYISCTCGEAFGVEALITHDQLYVGPCFNIQYIYFIDENEKIIYMEECSKGSDRAYQMLLNFTKDIYHYDTFTAPNRNELPSEDKYEDIGYMQNWWNKWFESHEKIIDTNEPFTILKTFNADLFKSIIKTNFTQESGIDKVVKDFIYKVDDSNKLTTQTEYDSVDEFFNEPAKNDIKLDTLVICTIDTKEPLIKLQKVEADNRTEFKFIVDIINEDNDNFMFKSIIKSQEQLNQLIQKTIEALRLYPKFNKYADDLEEYL